jgi:hypothetical protein
MYIPPLTAADLQLREQFETRTLENAAFRHREHVRLTWGYLTSEAPDAVAARLCRALLDLATSHGVADRFHHTLTVVWVRLIESARGAHPDLPFGPLVDISPWLLDKDAPLEYYTRDRLYSDQARREWVEPDRKPLPGV